MDFLPVAQQLEVLLRGVSDLHGEGELEKRLAESRAKSVPLVVKAGFDPTVPDLHLGHTVLMNKMRQFQDLGHRVVFLIGDFTAAIGDPTGRNESRPALTEEQVQAAAETYAQQAFKVLARATAEVAYNGTWFRKMSASDMIKLSSKYTVARMLERDDFHKRYTGNRPIHIHEFLYPLVQGYDSVALKCDIELGGQDQLFNLLVGRELMRDFALRPQMVMTTPLLLGTDARMNAGVLCGDKMSKSKGNYVALEEVPREMFGKVMSISDDLMWAWYDLLSALTPAALTQLKSDVAGGHVHPKNAKEKLAHEIVARFHGAPAADQARSEFAQIFTKHGVPDLMLEVSAAAGSLLVDVLLSSNLVASKGEARRLIAQGGIAVGSEKVSDSAATLSSGEHVIKVGKHRFLRARII